MKYDATFDAEAELNDQGQWLAPLNFASEVRAGWDAPERVDIHDVTLRDGEQTARIAFTPDEKLVVADELDKLGVASIEPGLLVTEEDRAVTAELVKRDLRAKVKPLIRVKPTDVENALDAGVPAIVLEFPVNPYLIRHVYDLTPSEVVRDISELARIASAGGVEVEFMGWDAFRVPSLEYLKEFFRATLQSDAVTRLTVADTFGMAHPSAIGHFFSRLSGWFPGVPLGFHIHNDFGLATASAICAVTAGASSIHSSICGLGERAGNVATEEVAVALQYLLGIETGIQLERLMQTAETVAVCARRSVSVNKPIIGRGLFEVESGIVVHLMDRLRRAGFGEWAFSPYPPATVGQSDGEIVFGRGTGRHAIASLLEDRGIKASQDQIEEITRRVKALGLVFKTGLPHQKLDEIISDVMAMTEQEATQ